MIRKVVFMENYKAETYGERIADTYDNWYSSPDESSIAMLSDLRIAAAYWNWESELDMMARVAGMKLVDRWGDWERGVFSVQQKVPFSVFTEILTVRIYEY